MITIPNSLLYLIVHRLRADALSTTFRAAPVSHSARDSPVSDEKGEDSRLGKAENPEPDAVNYEDEGFESREVRRGELSLSL